MADCSLHLQDVEGVHIQQLERLLDSIMKHYDNKLERTENPLETTSLQEYHPIVTFTKV